MPAQQKYSFWLRELREDVLTHHEYKGAKKGNGYLILLVLASSSSRESLQRIRILDTEVRQMISPHGGMEGPTLNHPIG